MIAAVPTRTDRVRLGAAELGSEKQKLGPTTAATAAAARTGRAARDSITATAAASTSNKDNVDQCCPCRFRPVAGAAGEDLNIGIDWDMNHRPYPYVSVKVVPVVKAGVTPVVTTMFAANAAKASILPVPLDAVPMQA